jgi:hypothetical protein
MADDLTAEELAAVTKGWRALQRQHDGFYYEQPPVKGLPPRGAFTLPNDIIGTLGDGDPKAAGHVIHSTFGIEPFASDHDPRVIDSDVVRDIGHGNLNAGHRVLKKFVAMLRAQKRYHGERYRVVPQPDGNHAIVAARRE